MALTSQLPNLCYTQHVEDLFSFWLYYYSELFGKLGWDNLLIRRKKHKAILIVKTVNDLTPHYLRELFQSRSTGYNLRNSENTLFVPKPRTNYGKRSFSYSGAVLWNELSQNMRVIGSLNQFKREIDNLFS